MDFRAKAQEMIPGSIDYHIHSGPDCFPRILNDIEIVKQAKEAGMRAVLLKSHVEEMAARAKMAMFANGCVSGEFDCFGTLALNLSVGGLNPEAVRNGIRMGVKQVYMPTIHAAHYLAQMGAVPMFAKLLAGGGLKGLYLLNDDGSVKDEVKEICDIIAEAGIVLATGHVSVEEGKALAAEAKKRGVQKIVVTHPTSPMEAYTIEDMKEILSLGATMLEHVVNDTTHQMKNPIPSTVISDAIKATGAANNIMSTDSGQVINPVPVKSLENFICMMLEDGISEADIRMMTRDNPAKMLGIE